MCDEREVQLSGFDHLLGPEAPGADANALDAPVDDRPNGLEVRFEPSRADIVRVADLPSHDGTLSANFTPLGHIYCTCEVLERER
jgi:hypothetical protein